MILRRVATSREAHILLKRLTVSSTHDMEDLLCFNVTKVEENVAIGCLLKIQCFYIIKHNTFMISLSKRHPQSEY